MPIVHSGRAYFQDMEAVRGSEWEVIPLVKDRKRLAATQPRDLLPLFMEHAPDMEYLVMSNTPLGKEFFAKATKLKHIAMAGSGIEHFDLTAATLAGVSITNASGGNARAVAEMTLACMFAAARHIPRAQAAMLSGVWQRSMGWELGGKTLGIIGLGAIGRELAALASAVGMRVIAHSRFSDPGSTVPPGVRRASFAEVLAEADFLSLHLPSQGRAVLGEKEIAAIKPGAFVCNFARGDLVDLDALFRALQDGHLRGAALDTFPAEPPDYGHPLFSLPNVVLTPHLAGSTWESYERVAAICVEELTCAARGERSSRCVNPEVYTGAWRVPVNS